MIGRARLQFEHLNTYLRQDQNEKFLSKNDKRYNIYQSFKTNFIKKIELDPTTISENTYINNIGIKAIDILEHKTIKVF